MTEHTRDDLLVMLRSPDPVERDDVAYIALVRRIAGGAEDEALVELGDESARCLTDPEIPARTFATIPHRRALKDALADTLRIVWPYLG